MPTTAEKSDFRLRTSAFDRASSLLITLLVMSGVVVSALVLIFLANRYVKASFSAPVKPVALSASGGGGGDGMPGSGDIPPDFDAVEIQEDPTFSEPQIANTLETVASAVAVKSSLLANDRLDQNAEPAPAQEFGDTRKRGMGEGGEGLGPGFGTGRGEGRGPGSGGGFGGGEGRGEPQREIRFEPQNLLEYAQWLDFWKIELGVLGQDNRVHYAYNLSQKTPSLRDGVPADEQRLFMNSARSRFAGLDRRLAARAGIAQYGRITLQFFPTETQEVLYGLERARAQTAGKTAEDIRRTVFRVTKDNDKYGFEVVDQVYR